MKIAFFEYYLNLQIEGGSMFSLDLYARKLMEKGHDVSVITVLSHKNNPGNKAKPYHMIEEQANYSNPIATDIDAQRILKKYDGQFDVYHIHNPWLLTAAASYRKNGGKTPVVADMNTYMFCTNFAVMDGQCHKACGLYKRVVHSNLGIASKIASIPVRTYQQRGLRMIREYIDLLFPVSPFAQKIFTEYGLCPDKMVMIPDGFDFSVFRPGEKGGTGPGDKPFNIICPSRFEYTKGVDIAIKAVKELEKQGIKDVVLHLAGNDGSEKENLIRLVRELQLAGRVVFHGHLSLDELLARYAQSQLFIHPARWFETFGRTVVEAMAFGLPVIVSNKGALGWVAADAGIVFESGDPADLASKIHDVYKNQQLRARLSKKAHIRALEFDVENTISAFIKAYNKLVKNK